MTSDDPLPPTDEQRHDMIALAAYYLAERRGFVSGGEEADWLEAERLIDRLIAERALSLRSGRDAQDGQIRYALKLKASQREV